MQSDLPDPSQPRPRYRRALTSLDALVDAGFVAPADLANLAEVARRYAVAVTPEMVELINPADQTDPIARQFVPTPAEANVLEDELTDPIGDDAHCPVPGIVHRYPDRALLKLTTVCPVYCRFCFRREMVGPGHEGLLADARLEAALAYLRATPAVREVIVTGGDPLVLSARRIGEVTRAIAGIPHVDSLRWHSRVPMVAPRRIDSTLVAALGSGGKQVRVAVHANHPAEFTADARAALARLSAGGIGLVSQSVLLAGVNDRAEVLADLMRAFVVAGVTPYYLHQLDLAPGTSHFRVPIRDGLALMRMLARAPGLTRLPRYVLDIPGGYGKIALDSGAVSALGAGLYLVTDRLGAQHRYRDPAHV